MLQLTGKVINLETSVNFQLPLRMRNQSILFTYRTVFETKTYNSWPPGKIVLAHQKMQGGSQRFGNGKSRANAWKWGQSTPGGCSKIFGRNVMQHIKYNFLTI